MAITCGLEINFSWIAEKRIAIRWKPFSRKIKYGVHRILKSFLIGSGRIQVYFWVAAPLYIAPLYPDSVFVPPNPERTLWGSSCQKIACFFVQLAKTMKKPHSVARHHTWRRLNILKGINVKVWQRHGRWGVTKDGCKETFCPSLLFAYSSRGPLN